MNTPEKNDDVLVGELRDVFEATAAAYRPDPLPTDLWDRAHRRSRTDRLQVVAACVLLVALAVGTFAWGRTAPVQPADVPDSGALPTRVHVPDDDAVRELTGADGQGTQRLDLDLGPVSVATVLSSGHLLAVGARDGVHHLRVLPDLDTAAGTDSTPVALSPDGTRLAWAYRDATVAPDDETSGVRVVDLASGDVTTHPVTGPGGERVAVRDVVWSSGSSYVALKGIEYTPGDGVHDQMWVGTLAVGSGGAAGTGGAVAAAPFRTVKWQTGVAVDDEGTVHAFTHSRHHVLRTTDDRLVNVGSVAGVHADWEIVGVVLSPDGTRVAVGGDFRPAAGFTTTELSLETDEPTPAYRSWGLPVEGATSYVSLRLVGWTPDGSLVGHTPTDQAVPDPQITSLSEAGVTTTLTTVDAQHDLVLTVATDLADADPVAFPAPEWDEGRNTWVPVVGLGLAGLVAGWLVWVLTRGRTAGGSLRTALRSVRSYAVPVALAVGLVATLAPLWPPTGSSLTVADGALPTTVHRPPEHVETTEIGDGTPDRLSVLMTGDTWSLTGIAADDGTHVRLASPIDHSSRRIWDEAVALSPDGRRVVLVYAREGADTADTVAGLEVINLANGSSDVIELRGENGRPVMVEEIAWSANGSHLTWVGDEAVRWDSGQSHFRGAARTVGVASVDSSGAVSGQASWQIERARQENAVTVTDDGVVHLLVGRRLVTFDVRTPQAAASERVVAASSLLWSGARVSPDGTRLVTGLNGGGTSDTYVTGLRTLDLTRTDTSVETLTWPATPDVPTARTAVLGWTPQGALMVASQVRFLSGPTPAVTVSRLGSLDATPQVMTTVDNAALYTVAVATDLADTDPVDFGEPRWPLSTERKILAWAFGIALVLSLTIHFLIVRRRGSYRWT